MPPNHRTDLRDIEKELLETAVREGYFKVPRQISLVELADKHGMTDIEAIETMNRGLDTMVRCAVQKESSCC